MDHEKTHEGGPYSVVSPTVSGEDEHHHEKKSALKKVKDKAKRIKDTIKAHGHGRDGAHDRPDSDENDDGDDEIVQDPEIHGSPMYKSAAIKSSNTGDEQGNVGRIETRFGDFVDVGREQNSGQRKRISSGTEGLEEDPQAPKDSPPKYESKVSDPTGTGSEEAGITPILRSLDKMKVSDEIEPKSEKDTSGTGSHDQFSPEETAAGPEIREQGDKNKEKSFNQSSHTQKISSATSSISDKAASVKNAVASKLSPVYEKVAGTVTQSGAGDSENRAKKENKGVSVKEYFAEKLRPGDEDRALSEVISEALHKRKEAAEEEDEGKWPMGAVTESEEVAKNLGTGEEGSGNGDGGGDSGEVKVNSGGRTGKAAVDRVKGAVESWFGKGVYGSGERKAQ